MAIDAADARVVGVAEIRQARRALAQRELERGHREQLRPDAENLQQVARRGVDRDDAVAEAVGEERRFGLLGGRGQGCHRRLDPWSTVHRATARTTACEPVPERPQPARRTRSSRGPANKLAGRVRVYNRVARFAFL